MSVGVIGVGGYGISVLNALPDDIPVSNTIAVDVSRTKLTSARADHKIQAGRESQDEKATVKYQKRLETVTVGLCMVFVIADLSDVPDPTLILNTIIFLQAIGITTICVILEHSQKLERKATHKVNRVSERIADISATLFIPKAAVGKYKRPNREWLNEYLSFPESHDLVQERAAYYEWYCQSPLYDRDIRGETIVGVYSLHRILEMLSEEYPRATHIDIMRIMSIPGYIHVSNVSALFRRKETLAYIVSCRAAYNDLLRTSLHCSEGILFILEVPMDMCKEDVALICERLHSFSCESVDSYFTINIAKNTTGVVSVKMLGTGTYASLEDE